ncbi:MAG: VOC family protein [Alphaproteobacteria bacterium]|nr:VOC family protein [Alphaproteobacteria bacterium]
MISYLMLGTNDLNRSGAFYDQLLGEMGAKRAYSADTYIAWGFGKGKTLLSVTRPYDGQPAAPGNGVMVALSVDGPKEVDRLYALALELGARDEGKPGMRGNGFYAGYFRDPDGNKLNFFHWQPQGA